MGVTAMTGPLVVYGAGTAPTDYNPQRGPSLFDQFIALADPRAGVGYQPGQGAGNAVAGWLAQGNFLTVDAVPSTLAVNNIAASQSPGGAGPITLVSSSGAGITVGASVPNLATGLTSGSLLAIDGAGGRVSYGSDSMIQLWDPTKLLGRNVRCTTTTASNITFTVQGFDAYGQPVQETMVANANTVSGKKAFKYIQSVSVSAACAGVTVGTGDVYGFPLRTDAFSNVTIYWAGTLISASTGYLAAVTTDPATATTGDVRGTYAVQSASDGSKRLTITQNIPAANIGSQVGLLGVAQFAG